MLFQLTDAGRALLDANPTGVQITRADFGSAFNYVPADDPTGLVGSVVYTTNAVFSPTIANLNALRYSVFVPGPVGPFTFGELALYSGATLFGVGASVVPTDKVPNEIDNQLRVDIYIDTAPGSRYASFEVVSSETRNFFPRVKYVDDLVAPHLDTNNAYVVYGTAQPGEGFLAYSDPSGIWSFSSKPHQWWSGKVDTISNFGMTASELIGQEYQGTVTDLVIQFINGPQRGFCRRITDFNSNGSVSWTTSMVGTLPNVGDDWVIVGPTAAVGFTGMHNTLAGLQGGQADEYFHLTDLEHAGVLYPRMKTKVLSAPTYTILPTDDDTYIEVPIDCTVSLDNISLTTYPIGGLTIFRVKDSILTVQGINGTTMNPANSIAIDVNGSVLTVAVVRRSATHWDFVAPEDASGGSSGGNVSHVYPNSRSEPLFVPRYDASGSATGPTAQVELSRLALPTLGGMRLYPGDQSVAPVWTAPALLVWPQAKGTIGTTPTGLPNTSSLIPLGITINGTPYTVNVMGSAAQTYAALVVAFNLAAVAALGGAALMTLSLSNAKLVHTVTSTAPTTTMSVTNATLFTSLTNSYLNPELAASSAVNAVNDTAIALDGWDSLAKAVRPIGTNGVAIGFRSKVDGVNGVVIGGPMTTIVGNNDTAIGVDGGYIIADDSELLGGRGNVIAPAPGGTAVSNSAIVGGTNNKIQGPTGKTVAKSVIIKSDNVNVTDANDVVAGSANITVSGNKSVVLATETANLPGNQNLVVGTSGLVAVGTDKLTVVGGANLDLTNAKAVVAFHNQGLTLNQSSALHYPTDNLVSGVQTAQAFAIHTSRTGSGAALQLTTNGQALTANNGMKVPLNAVWSLTGTIAANAGGLEFKSWHVRAMAYNKAGVVTIAFGYIIEVLGETANAINYDLDLIVDPTATDQIYFVCNSANAVTGFDPVSLSALIQVSAARSLI